MASKVLSIEIGYSLMNVCEVDYKIKNPRVYNSFIMETPQGVFEDGVINQNENFAKAVKEELEKRRIKTKQVVFSVLSTKIASREVNIPFVKENRIPDVVRANASDYFPVDLTQYQLAHSILGVAGEDKGNKSYKLLVFAMPSSLSESYAAFARAVGLEMIAVDYSGNSIYHSVKNECATGTQMIIKVNERSTLIMILKEGIIDLTRIIPYGIDEAIQTIIDTNAWGDNLSYQQAVEIARHKTVISRTLRQSNQMEVELKEELETEHILASKISVTSSLSYFVSGVSRVIDYYNSMNADRPIERTLLTGIGGDFSGLSKLLTNELNVKVTTLTKVEGINIDKAFKEVSFGEYIGCIGSSIEPLGFMEGTSLKASFNKSSDSKDYTALAVFVLILGIGVSVVFAVLGIIPYNNEKDNNDYLKARQQELLTIEEIHNAYLEAEGNYRKMVYFDEFTDNRLEELVAFIEEMEVKMPSSFRVTSFSANTESVSLSVEVMDKTTAALVIDQFRTFESVSLIEVPSINESESDIGEKVVTFNATLVYKPIEKTIVVPAESEVAETANNSQEDIIE